MSTHMFPCRNKKNIHTSWLIQSILDIAMLGIYHIWPNYCTYPYKHTVKQFCSLQITASVLFVYLVIKAYVVGTHLGCTDLLMQFKWVPTTYTFIKKWVPTTYTFINIYIKKWVPTTYTFIKKIGKKCIKRHQISPLLIFFIMYPW